MRIAHISDVHIRFGSRHEEYKLVFERLYKNLKESSPDRIVVTGDIMHQKVSLSPASVVLMSDFLINLSKIAPTDVIAGNHDMNMKQTGQGDVVSPLYYLSKFLGNNVVHLITEENKTTIDYSQNHVFYYSDSLFVDVDDKLTYGIFSCKDQEILKLNNKLKDRIYVALWHGALYGARMDNGYENINQASWKKSVFKNFDIVMMGDFHEHQTFENWREIEVSVDEIEKYTNKGWEQTSENSVRKKVANMAYAGSLIQQNFSESIDKGYLLWDFNKKNISIERKIVPNEWGFAKITITRGESFEERIKNIEFSNNRRKTKVIVVVEEFEENKSKEKEHQIKQLIKDRYKCESVRVEWKILQKTETANSEDLQEAGETFEARFEKYIEKTEHDLSNEELDELFKFSYRIEKELGLDQEKIRSKKFDILSFEVRNLFTFPDTPTHIPLENFNGITGIFGQNYCGKSNTIRALVFGLFEVVVGTKDKQKIVNIYTPSNKGYVIVIISIDGVKYKITREVHEKKSGGNSYPTKFEVWDENLEKWKEEINDKTTAENTGIKHQINEAIGSYEDFSTIALQAGDNDSDFLSMKQQPKNDLVARYLNLADFKTRKDYVNENFFNPLRNKIKASGASQDIKEEMALKKQQKQELEDKQKSLEEEYSLNEIKKTDLENKVLELTKKLSKTEEINYTSKGEIENEIELNETLLAETTENNLEIKLWLDSNFKKEIPFEGKKTIEGVVNEINQKEQRKTQLQQDKLSKEKWIQSNPIKELLDTKPIQDEIKIIEQNISECKNKIISFQGKKCPTCGNVSEKPNPVGEKEQALLKENFENQLKQKNKILEQIQKDVENNNVHQNYLSNIQLINQQIETIDASLKNLEQDKKTLESSKGIVATNQLIDIRVKEYEENLQKIKKYETEITKLQNVLEKFDTNEANKKNNAKIQSEIDEITDDCNAYKQNLVSLNLQIRSVSGQLAVAQKEVQDKQEMLENMKEQDLLYRRYSLYLQAVDRPGIPAMVIKTKLPQINEQIQNILQDIVTFKVELEINDKGDVSEFFYFREDKSDALPMSSRASASQKFIVSLAIKNALHEVSTYSVSQPSIIMIDEGFGSLDVNHINEVQGMLSYLSTKYKNVLIITHLNDIKDCVDNIIEVHKNRDFLSTEEKLKNPNAGISQFTFSA